MRVRQGREGPLVEVEGLSSQRFLERGGIAGGEVLGEFGADRPHGDASRLVADLVQEDRAEVGEEGARRARLEAVDLPQGSQDRVLHQIVGVENVACTARHAAVGEAPQRRQVAPEEELARRVLAGTRALDESRRALQIRAGPGDHRTSLVSWESSAGEEPVK
jgi:hypothetical protein